MVMVMVMMMVSDNTMIISDPAKVFASCVPKHMSVGGREAEIQPHGVNLCCQHQATAASNSHTSKVIMSCVRSTALTEETTYVFQAISARTGWCGVRLLYPFDGQSLQTKLRSGHSTTARAHMSRTLLGEGGRARWRAASLQTVLEIYRYASRSVIRMAARL